ncbi:MAG: Gfo/Idh/MocA family oxidoreductase, partial [Leptospiraceae bacterium]|nr:Gfo/Idh/MocA family oxidoreductase [Leptospiraceae bacterium]
MAADRRIPTALFGLGRIAWQLEKDPLRNKPCSHAGAMATVRSGRHGVFHITSICDHNTQKIRDFQKFWKQPITCAERDYRAVFKNAIPELAVIAVSAGSHTAIALHAIESGCRAIVLEKPMALSLSDARKIASAAERHNCQVRINFERRYHPGYVYVQRLIASQKFGELRAIRGRVLTGASFLPESSNAIPVGPLMHDAIHWIDLLLWYVGHPEKVSARMIPAKRIRRDLRIEDTAFVQFQYPEFTATLESGGR